MNDRGMKKWLPFDSLTDTYNMKKELNKKKIKIEKPDLSEDQLESIEEKILEAYFNKDIIKIHYYFNNNILIRQEKIKSIDNNKKQIILSDNTKILFKQITKVE